MNTFRMIIAHIKKVPIRSTLRAHKLDIVGGLTSSIDS